MGNKKKILLCCIIAFIIFSLVILGTYYLKPIFELINEHGLQNVLMDYEEKGKYIYFIICFLQPIVLPLPEPITIIAGSSVFGAFKSAVIGFSGTILGIIIMFLFSRFASKKFIRKVFNNEKLERFNSFIQKNETFVIFTLFILPILPDEIVCAGSGLVRFNGCKFFIVASISKLITTFSLSYSLQIISVNTILLIVVILIIISIIKFH